MNLRCVLVTGLIGLLFLVCLVQLKVPRRALAADGNDLRVGGAAITGDAGFVEQPTFGVGATIPIAWGDYDNDDDLDLAVGNFSGSNQLFTNNGDGTFGGTSDLGGRNSSTFAVAWGDFDNDGDLDAAIGNGGNQQNTLYVNNGNGSFTAQDAFGTDTTIAVAWGDHDNDGDLDLAVGNGILGLDRQNFLYVNNGDGSFTEQAAFGVNQTGSLVWGDYDNDGDLDLAVGNGGFGTVQQNLLYINNGDGTFTEEAQFGTGDTASIAWADADNDGDLDLAVGNWGDGSNANALYINNGDGTFTQRSEFGSRGAASRDTNAIAWGDFNNDGFLDLAVGNGDFGSADQNFLYINNGDGTFVEVAEFGLGSTDSVAWGDYDNDGDIDLAAGNEHTPTQNYLYTNTFDGNRPLVLHLIGHYHDQSTGYSNRDGVGAKVAVYEAGFVGDADHLLGYREISAHGGFSSQNAVDVNLGVPGHDVVDVRIRWPGSDGLFITQDLLGLTVPDRIVVHEEGEPAEGGCDAVDPVLAEPSGIARNRYLSYEPNSAGELTAIRVTLVDVNGFVDHNGGVRWVGLPVEYTDEGADPFMAAPLQCDPLFMDWSGVGPCSIYGAEIVPGSVYELAQVHESCADALDDEAGFSEPVTLMTAKWGDVVEPFFVDGGAAQPDFSDIASLVDKFQSLATAPPKARAQLQPNVVRPESPIDFSDIAADIDAFTGRPYPFDGPGSCP